MHESVAIIVRLLEERGGAVYGGEAVTQLEHAVQSAQLAVDEGAASALVVAALLHDIGHILTAAQAPPPLPTNLDDQHEARGCAFLARHFGPAVAEPVRLHVAAKRYLCSTEPEYASRLSPTSYQSYLDQGGEMDDAQRRAFEAEPFYGDALRLRRWDDLAKDPNQPSPPASQFARYLDECIVD